MTFKVLTFGLPAPTNLQQEVLWRVLVLGPFCYWEAHHLLRACLTDVSLPLLFFRALTNAWLRVTMQWGTHKVLPFPCE